MTEKGVLNILFILGLILASLSCFVRADYNLALFAFAFFIWDNEKVHSIKYQVRLTYFFLYTLLFDILWIAIWIFIWQGSKLDPHSFENKFHKVIMVINIANVFVKLASTIFMARNNEVVKDSLKPSTAFSNFLDFVRCR
eukprot:TRINITY_DN2284_c0_g1_i2.p1 TRINITY_DN2284_c0_g1~~TRINITY_DN2284_c0_g1_i2.p1  ORF type:complete len:140 (-),score=16.54 TRINITY_DN2284_c0_g1_i2:122-541(-)